MAGPAPGSSRTAPSRLDRYNTPSMMAGSKSRSALAAVVTLLGLALVPAGLAIAWRALALSLPSLGDPPLFRHASEILLGVVVTGVGAVALAIAGRTRSPRLSTRLPAPRPAWDPIAVAAAVSATALTALLWSNLARDRIVASNGLLLLASLILFALAVSRLDRRPRHRWPLSGRDLAAAVALGAGSAALNSAGLLRWEFAWIGDELAFFERAARIVRGTPFNPFDLTDVYGAHPTLDSLYQAIVMRVLGVDMWSWRFAEVLVVAATAALVYLAGTLLAGRLAGAIAAVVVGSSHYLMAFSRIPYNNLHALPVTTLVVLMIALAWRSGRAVFTWLAGCAVGLTVYTFAPATFIGPTVAVVLGIPFLLAPSRRQLGAGALLVLAFVIVVVPALLVTPASELAEVAQRESRRELAAVAPGETFRLALIRSAVAFVANHEWHHHYVGAALIDPVTMALVAIGLAGALLGIRRRAHWLALVWLGVGLVGIAATSYLAEPHLTRLVYLLPPVGLLAGLGGATLHRALARRLGPHRWIACLFVVAIVAAIPVANAVLLHRVGPRHTRRPPETLAVRALQQHPGRTIVFVGETRNQNLQALLGTYPEFGGRFLVMDRDELELPPPPCGHRLQVPLLWTEDQNTAEMLQRQLGSSYRMQVERDSRPDASLRAWLFTPVDGESETGSRVCFADANLEMEIEVGVDPTDRPWDLAADSSGNVFVAVRGDNRIHAFSAGGRLRSMFGPDGTSDDRFGELSGVVVDSRDSLWVLDSAAERVFRFGAGGEPMAVEIPAVGYAPRGIGLAPNGDLLVAVTGNGEVRRYRPQGDLVTSVTRTDDQLPDLSEPTAAAITPDGDWLVLDAGRGTVWRLAADGHLVTSWSVQAGITAADSGGLTYHPTGHVLVTEPSNPSDGWVSFFHLDGTACARWTIPGVSAPFGIDVDRDGRVLLAFPESRVVRVYRFGTARRH